MIQNGLLNKWKEVYWTLVFCKANIKVNQSDTNENALKLKQVSLAFYILLCCLPLSIATLLIEIQLMKIYKSLS